MSIDVPSAGLSDAGDLGNLYERRPDAPLAKGDHVNGVRVLGFAFNYPARELGRDADVLLLDGDEDCDEPPARPVPSRRDEENGTRIDRCGCHPAQSLRPGLLIRAQDLAPHLPSAVDSAIFRSAGGGIRRLIEAADAQGHSMWLIGGATRDLLKGAPENDLDFCGTIPVGEMHDLAGEALARDGSGDYRLRVSPRRVFSIKPEVSGKRILEYKPLALTGLRFPASGGDLNEDAACRDLTVNSIYYDPMKEVVADPTGKGVEHLFSVPLKLVTPYCGDDPMEQAQIVLRGLKFWLRWPDADVSQLTEWARSLPDDLPERIPDGAWFTVEGAWERCVRKRHRTRARELADRLGPAARRLLDALLSGASDDA